MVKTIRAKALLLSLVVPLVVGGLSGFLTRNSTDVYKELVKPPLSPPGWIFPVVWTILFTLMGVSYYLVSQSYCAQKQMAKRLYGVQLLVNFIWPLLFFTAQAYLFSLIWLIVLVVLVALMIWQFFLCRPLAAQLQIPYLLWICFATYLNFGVYLLNR